MHAALSKALFYHPCTLLKGEPIGFLIKQYRNNQWLPEKKLEELQLARLKAIIKHAFRHSIYYRRLYENAGVSINDIKSMSDLAKLPTISKADLIEHMETMSTYRSKFFSSSKTTGGSTGQPVRLYKNSMALARERSATWRSYEWADVAIGDAQLRFWGVPHSRQGAIKATITDLIANRMRVSAFDLTPTSLFRYYQQATKFRPSYIYGYVSAIEELAKYITANGLGPLPSVKSVITTSEVLSAGSKRSIENAFSVSVYNEYGCGEVGSIAHECKAGSMHTMADNLYIEIDGESDSGEIIVTDFFNLATPLIRYRLGDYATLAKSQCSCGRTLPVIEAIHGRAYDILETPSGRTIHPEAIIYIFESIQTKTNAFKQFQAIQTSPRNVDIKIVPNGSWSEAIKHILVQELKQAIDSDIHFTVNITNAIPREASGKMRLVKRMG